MCGVFYADEDTIRDVEQIVDEVARGVRELPLGHDIRPTQQAPVITMADGALRLSGQRWGYPGLQGRGVIFNARAESVKEKKLFSGGINSRRAVIPASRFYEWSPAREKNTFCRRDGKTLFLAGFYDLFENEERFVILTTAANESMQRIHDRMPLVLEREQLKAWCTDTEAADEILHQTPVLLKRQAEYEQMTLF